jgi:hypothetical protein
MIRKLIILLIIPLFSFGQNETEKQELVGLNEYLFKEYVLKHNTHPLKETATEDFILIAAPGILENKQQAIDGVGNLNISDLKVSTDEMIISENLAIIVGVLEMKGTIMNNPVPPKIRYSSTFIKENGKWKLQMRTMTPMRM